MKIMKCLLTAILMVSTGLSAMELYDPAGDFGKNKALKFNQPMVSAKVKFGREAGSAEAYLMAQFVKVPNENGKLQSIQLPLNVAQHIADYAGVEKEESKTVERIYNALGRHTIRPLIVGSASIPMLAAVYSAGSLKCWLAGCALLTSGLMWYSREDFNHNCHCTYDCYHAENDSIPLNLFLGLAGASSPGVLISSLLYPLTVGLIGTAEYGLRSKISTGCLFGIKAASVPLVPLFAQRLLEGTGSQLLSAGMLATAAFASYSGLKDLIAYNKQSYFKSFDSFLIGRDMMCYKKIRDARNQA